MTPESPAVSDAALSEPAVTDEPGQCRRSEPVPVNRPSVRPTRPSRSTCRPTSRWPSGWSTPGAVASTLRELPRVIAVANQKGGVGKTTTAVNLGACLAELGYRTLVVDLDPQGNASTGLGINIRALDASMYDVILNDAPIEDCIEGSSVRNLFVAPASLDLAGAEIELVPAFSRELKLRNALGEVQDDYDYVLIDCPPSLGLLTVNALAAATEVLVPIQCEYYALEGLGQLLRNVELVQRNLNPALEVSAIVLVMYDARTKLAEQVAQEVRAHFGDKVLKHVVPRTVRLSEAPSFGQPIITFDPSSRGCHRVPGAGEGGQWWHAAAGWVRVSGRSSPRPRARPPVDETTRSQLREIPVTQVQPNPLPAPSHFDEAALVTLTASVSEVGVLQPVLVREVAPDQYELIAGERRWRAAQKAGLTSIPALVRTADTTRVPRAGAGREPPP